MCFIIRGMTLTRRAFFRSSTALGAAVGGSLLFANRNNMGVFSSADDALPGAHPAGAAGVPSLGEPEGFTGTGIGVNQKGQLLGGTGYLTVTFPPAAGEGAQATLRFESAAGHTDDRVVHPEAHDREGDDSALKSDPVELPEGATAVWLPGEVNDPATRLYLHVVEAPKGTEERVFGAGIAPYAAPMGMPSNAAELQSSLEAGATGLAGSLALAGTIAGVLQASGLAVPGLPAPGGGAGAGGTGGGANVIDGLRVVSRREWGANEALMGWTPRFTRAQLITVHHTAMATPANGDYAANVRSIYGFHASSANGGRGWGDIGYHLLIAPDGTVFQGRTTGTEGQAVFQSGSLGGTPMSVTAGHVYNANDGNIGVCLLGNFMQQAPTPAAINSLVRVLRHLCHGLGLDPRGSVRYVNNAARLNLTRRTITGHRDWGDVSTATACPGDRAYALMDQVRSRV